MRGEIIYEYHRLNSKDQKVVRRWLWANIVVGAILLTGLIALTSKLPGDEAGNSATRAGSNSGHATSCVLQSVGNPRKCRSLHFALSSLGGRHCLRHSRAA
jgi:hypothetical protein